MFEQGTEKRVFEPGARFLHYVVESFLGSGASGEVYQVRHEYTLEQLALKVNFAKDRNDVEKATRSLGEARALFGLRHANIVRVIDLAVEKNGTIWQLMELVHGISVADLIDGSRRLSPLYAIDIAIEVAWGLQAAHEQQIIHRDVRPANVMIARDGRVKLLDFSLAKIIPLDFRTADQQARGTTGYMSPDHLGQAPPSPQFDVYALGFMLFEMMAGRHPFGPLDQYNTARLVTLQHTQDPPSLAAATGLPAYCDEVIRCATAKDPLNRYPGMWPFAQALIALRARLQADPAAAELVNARPAWEQSHRVERNPNGWTYYRPPRSFPPEEPAPSLPRERIVVAGAPAAFAVMASPAPVPIAPVPTAPAPTAAALTAAAPTTPAPTAAAPTAPPAAVGRPRLAATMPMNAIGPPLAATVQMLAVPTAPAAHLADPGAPTARRGSGASARRLWWLMAAGAVMILAGVTVWLLVLREAPAASAGGARSNAAPEGSASAAARRLPLGPKS